MDNRKVHCHNNENYSYVDFFDFEDEGQLPEFASIFTKITDIEITEYLQGPGTTLAKNDINKNEISILWDDMCGCMVYAANNKRKLLVVTAYKMLCEMYRYYDSYHGRFDNILKNNDKITVNHNGCLANFSELSESDKADIIEDINALIAFIEK